MKRLVPVAIVACLSMAAPAWCGGDSSNDPPGESEVNIDRGTRVSGGFGFGAPTGASASVRLMHGLSADVKDGDGRVKAVCAVPIPYCAGGFLLEVDAGSGGGKVSLGLGARARVEDEEFRGTAGLELKLSVARTWGSAVGTHPGLTYVGPELGLSILHVELTLGVLARVHGAGGRAVLFSWGLGLGL
jgi:hypothetical protein